MQAVAALLDTRLRTSIFRRDAVILLFAHSSSGSAGIILNRPSNVKVADIQADASAGLPSELASNT